MDALANESPELSAKQPVHTLTLGQQANDASYAMPPQTRQLSAQEALFRRGEAAEHLHQIVQGAIMTSRQLPGRRRQIVDFAFSGRLIGLTPGKRHDCTAIALVNTVVHSFDRGAAEQDKAHHQRLTSAMGDEIMRLRDLSTSLGRKTAIERLAAFLIDMSERNRAKSIRLPMSRQDIADYLGLMAESVSRNFTSLKRSGAIKTIGKTTVCVMQPSILKSIAAGAAELGLETS